MKRSKAFILAETLTGIALQALFLLALCTAFYLLLSFYTQTQQILTAREKGQRVIAYFDARIRNAGLGLTRCSGSADIREKLSAITQLSNDNLALPVAITYSDTDAFSDNTLNEAQPRIIKNSLGHETYCGNILTILYAERSLEYQFFIVALDYQQSPAGANFAILNFSLKDKGKTDEKTITDKEYKDKTLYAGFPYFVASSIGEPFRVSNDIKRRVYANVNSSDKERRTSILSLDISPAVNPADEMHYLKCKRLFVNGAGTDRNFTFKDLTTTDNLTTTWGDMRPHEQNILEIYMELDTETKIFDLYVLSSGGIDSSTKRTKPSDWRGRWKEEYTNHALYVSKATWKLYNLTTLNLP